MARASLTAIDVAAGAALAWGCVNPQPVPGVVRWAFSCPVWQTTLGAVRQSIVTYSDIDPVAFAIVHDDAVFVDDGQPSGCPRPQPH